MGFGEDGNHKIPRLGDKKKDWRRGFGSRNFRFGFGFFRLHSGIFRLVPAISGSFRAIPGCSEFSFVGLQRVALFSGLRVEKRKKRKGAKAVRRQACFLSRTKPNKAEQELFNAKTAKSAKAQEGQEPSVTEN
jgi:hypothetical protein